MENKLIQFDTIEPTTVEWLWYPYIPLGKLTLMQGDPGSGKTMLCLKIASMITNGELLPCENEEANPILPKEPGIVVYQTAEDGLADTIIPRLMTMNPNLARIYTIDESDISLSLLDIRIEDTLQRLRPRLMIIDPLQAYLGSKIDMHRANEVRPVLAQIGRLAEKYQCSIIFIMHMNKMAAGKTMYRALGSIDIPAAARSMLTIGKNPENADERVMCHIKSSLAVEGRSLCYQVDFDNGGIVFGDFCDLTSDEVLLAPSKKSEKTGLMIDEAKEFLKEMLEGGYAKASDVIKAASAIAIKKRTLSYARTELGIKTKRKGFGSSGVQWWYFEGNEIPEEKYEELNS